MKQLKKENTFYYSILGKKLETGYTTLSVRKEKDVMTALKKDTQAGRIKKLREVITMFQPTAESLRQKIKQLPAICPGYHFVRCNDTIHIRHYNGIVTIQINALSNAQELCRLKANLQMLPQTRAVITGYDNKHLIVLVRVLYANGTLPSIQEEIRTFHETAYKIVLRYLRPYIPSNTDIADTAAPETSFHHTLDQDLFYNPLAEPIYLNQSLEPFENTTPQILKNTQNIILRLHEFMSRNYELRYNTLKDIPEYRPLHPRKQQFAPITPIVQNSMALDALEEGLNVWDRDVKRYLYSNRIQVYNPVEDYLKHTGQWDGQSYIKKISDCVKCDHPHWELLFRRWFLCMVANWQDHNRQYANCTSPLLIGKQGYQKSTFCRLLLPPELRFGFTDRLDIEKKSTAELYLSRFLLINLDEFDQINNRQQAFLKHLLQKTVSNIRTPYSSILSENRRYASFIGTSNTEQLLYDTDGSRRFFCVKVNERIDFPEDIDYRQLYAEALHALKNGERSWFNKEEETLLQTYNRTFEIENKYAQLFWTYYRRPRHTNEGTYLSCTQLLRSLCTASEFSKLGSGHIASFGKYLQKWELEKRHDEGGNFYKVVAVRFHDHKTKRDLSF